MPSSSSFTLNLNFDPIVGSIQAIPTEGYSLNTIFQIKILEVKDDDLPIIFKFYLYQDVKKKNIFLLKFFYTKKKKIKKKIFFI
jgi:hypothetical protein